MLQRKNGATLSEIIEKMGWQKHTVRGFVAGALKGAGYEVESFKPEEESAPTASIRNSISIRFFPDRPARHCRGGLFYFWAKGCSDTSRHRPPRERGPTVAQRGLLLGPIHAPPLHRDLLECAAVALEAGLLAAQLFPPLHDHIDVLRVQFEAAADAR